MQLTFYNSTYTDSATELICRLNYPAYVITSAGLSSSLDPGAFYRGIRYESFIALAAGRL